MPTLFAQQYSRDDGGRITQKVETILNETHTSNYGYDTAGRLTSVTTDGSSRKYSYDDNSNRLPGTYDAQDRLVSTASASYTYTANGELATKTDASGTTSYSYDELGNLLHVTLSNGTTIDYTIDGQNRRVGKKVNGVLTQQWLYADQLRIVAEITPTVTTRFIYASRSNVPDYMIRAGVTYRIISDHLGSPRLVVDTSTGALFERIDYDEWGNALADSSPGFIPFGFAGGLYDRDTGLIRFGARDYDPGVGRWVAKNPIRFADGDSNFYSYVWQDPVNIIDPIGYSGVITIHSNGVNGSSDAPYEGHSWITYQEDGGETHSYGTYGNNPGGNPNGLVVDWELEHLDKYGSAGDASRSMWIDDNQERRLMRLIDRYKKLGERGWSQTNPCSAFAKDAWLAATGENLDDYHHGITATTEQSIPQALRESIIRANGGIAHRVVRMQPQQ